jgi:hypothetical protein
MDAAEATSPRFELLRRQTARNPLGRYHYVVEDAEGVMRASCSWSIWRGPGPHLEADGVTYRIKRRFVRHLRGFAVFERASGRKVIDARHFLMRDGGRISVGNIDLRYVISRKAGEGKLRSALDAFTIVSDPEGRFVMSVSWEGLSRSGFSRSTFALGRAEVDRATAPSDVALVTAAAFFVSTRAYGRRST